MYIFAEPVTEEEINGIQNTNRKNIEDYERSILGLENNKEEQVTSGTDSGWRDIRELVDRAMERDQHPEDDAQTEVREDPENNVAKPLRSQLQDLQLSVEDLVRKDQELDAMLLNSFQTAQADRRSTAEEDRLERSARAIITSAKHCSGVSELLRKKMREEEKLDQRLTYLIDRVDRLLARLLVNHNTQDQSAGAPTANDDVSSEDDLVDQSHAAAERQVIDEDTPHESTAKKADCEADVQRVVVDESTKEDAAASEDGATAQADTSESDTAPSHPRKKSKQEATKAHTSEVPKENLLGMTLTIRNKVNGEYVTRPESLSHEDKWEVEYSLREIEGSSAAWSLYNACQTRRKSKFAPEEDDQRTFDWYRQHLMKLTNSGRRWRSKQDELDEKKGMVVFESLKRYDQEVSQPASSTAEENEVEDVDSYLSWLYSRK